MFRAKVYGVAGFERQFAVKRFHLAFIADPATAEAVASAARVYGGLEHPRITRLHEYGVTGGHAFTATELVDGLDLARLLSLLGLFDQKLPHGGIAALISQIARTLGYAHGRGICHLGLCPTNLVLTTDGEARITDFGFLAPRLPKHPEEDPSLRARLPYLAPEQLAHELTSAATDVFQLGAIAYEMFMGKAAFAGGNPHTVGQAIKSGKVPPLDVPKPLAAVIQRCLSRSPFERYPDARALADGIDAAARGLSLPGGLADIGQIVRELLERSRSDDEGEMSGALSFPLPAPPRGEAMMDHVQSDGDLPATTIRDPGAPPSAPSTPPVPVGLAHARRAKARASSAPPLRHGRRPLTMEPLVGPVEELDEEMPTVIRERARGFVHPTPVSIAVVDKNTLGSLDTGKVSVAEATQPASGERATVALTPAPPILPTRRASTPEPIPSLLDVAEELSGSHLQSLDSERIVLPTEQSDAQTAPVASTLVPSPLASTTPEPPAPASAPDINPAETLVGPDSLAPAPHVSRSRVRANLPETISDTGPSVQRGESWEPLTPIPRIDPPSGPTPIAMTGTMTGGAGAMAGAGSNPRSAAKVTRVRGAAGSRMPRVAIWAAIGFGALLLAGGGYLGYSKFIAGPATGADEPAKPIAIAPADAGPPVADATAKVVAVTADASIAAATADASTAAITPPPVVPPPDQTPTNDGKLTIRSKPSGAKIYLDGSPIGKTPHTMDATADRHRLAIIQPGYKLYTAEIDGTGRIEVALEEAAPPDGPGGIKVRCTKKNRYIIFVDGVDTGQLCPSERIGVELGAHTVEIYDPVTETRREFPATVDNTRHSLRVRVD